MELTILEHERRSSLLLGLSGEDRAERQKFLGASDATIIMGGDKDKIYRLWQEKIGDTEPEDLSDNLPVQLGTFTEALNLHWFSKKTGKRVTGQREKIVHPSIPFIRATLDGRTTHPENNHAAVVDAKHVNAFNFDKEACLQKYAPQLTIQMACSGYGWGLLSIFSGTTTWEWVGLEHDPLYEAQVIAAMKDFWQCVQSRTPPCVNPNAVATMPVDQMRTVDMRLSNSWVTDEAEYLIHEDSAGKFEKAKKNLKSSVEADVREASGPKLRIRRGQDGSLRFSKVK